jgi:hypothetical protein
MEALDTAKPATETVNGLRNIEQLGGELNWVDTTGRLQVARLIRRCAISAAAAEMLAPLVFGEGGAA